MNAVPTRRELLAWALAIVLAVSVLVVSRPNDADAGVAGIEVAFISTGENFPDALGAGPAAALGIGPILLVGPDSIPNATLDELNRLEPQTIYIVGGTAVISPAVQSQLEALSFSPTVTRLAGGNRYETAAALSAEIFPHAGFLGTDDKAADSDLLDGKDSSAFLETGDKAADSDLLDGFDSSAFLMETDVIAAHAGGGQFDTVGGFPGVVVQSVTLTAPSAGVVVADYSANAVEETAGDAVRCEITTGTEVGSTFTQWWESPGSDGEWAVLGGTRGFDVEAGEFTVNLVCEHFGSSGTSTVREAAMTAIFLPDAPAP